MERVLRSHYYGPHRVDVVEVDEDESVAGYQVVIDAMLVTEQSLGTPPSQDDLAHIDDRCPRRSHHR